VRVRVAPSSDAEAAVTELTTLDSIDELSAEQLSTIAIVAYLGTATRRQIESILGEDSEGLLRRLERGFLERAQDEAAVGALNVYQVSALALAAIGYHDPSPSRPSSPEWSTMPICPIYAREVMGRPRR
jgi:chromosome segregation and condensation protein ScpB